MADRNFDGRVERTRFRPLANGEISLIWAMVFLAAQLVPAASLLVFLAPFARLLAVGMLPLSFASALWGPLAFAIMFGLSFSLVLTLVLIPVLYYRSPADHRAE